MLKNLRQASPILNLLCESLALPQWSAWPDCVQLNALLPLGTETQGGHPVSFYPQDEALPHPELGYEQRIAASGIVSTRPENWHDVFNALMWVRFPLTKAAMNALHLQELARQPDTRRNRTRDALTLLDESGVLVACADPTLAEALRGHHWHTLFWDNRPAWDTRIGAFVIGHALYEKVLSPYLGITGKALILPVTEAFFEIPLNARFQQLDQQAATHIKTAGAHFHPRELTPLPVLGVPGWYADNEDAEFYDNTAYFRPKRSG